MSAAVTEVSLVSDISTLSSNEKQRCMLLAKRMEAFSHPTRLRALHILAHSPENTVSVKVLTDLLGVAKQATISRHIQRLVLAGFLECVELRGNGLDIRHCYHVRRDAISDALDELCSYMSIAEATAG
jgi:DNA-binding transcriptional ArsR family regulator